MSTVARVSPGLSKLWYLRDKKVDPDTRLCRWAPCWVRHEVNCAHLNILCVEMNFDQPPEAIASAAMKRGP